MSRILNDVKRSGDGALLDYSRRFDCPEMTTADLRVSEEEINAAVRQADDRFCEALEQAATRIESFHRRQLRNSWIETSRTGSLLGQLVRPVDSAGVYVPGGRGGKTPLVSSVLMGAIPAVIAGVERIVMATPPTSEGSVAPQLLTAARRAGVREIYKVGSAWAIAALAYGTETIGRTDVIVGPGNLYVTLAKKLVSGTVGIDMIAGPSEILIVADRSADPEYIAADLLSQAEHDPLATAILLSDSRSLAQAASAALKKQLEDLPRREIASAALSRFGAIVVVEDIAQALALANRIAPEHLELLIREPLSYIGQIRNAGAVFLGPYSPEAVGDYMAGPNHVLPTAGTARFSSALSVDNFLKTTSLIHYSGAELRTQAEQIRHLAEIEGLRGHSRSISLRLGRRGPGDSPKN